MDIDLNSDLGEGCGLDAELMPLITSANICCGFHAGSATTAQAALALAVQHHAQVGAHPGYADRENFGRRELSLSEREIFDLCREQVYALKEWADGLGVPIRYVKPHGALYNQACRDETVARPVVAAARDMNLPLMGLPGSRMEEQCQGQVGFIAEGFADRRYLPDGTLVPRSRADAFVRDIQEAVEQANWLIAQRGIRSLCVHGDNPQALVFVRGLRAAFDWRGIGLRAFA